MYSFTLLSSSTPSFTLLNSFPPNFISPLLPLSVTGRPNWTPRRTILRVSSPDDQNVIVSSPLADARVEFLHSASDVVKSFYAGINAHDLASVEDLIADNCVYEDLIFSRPFVGRKDILQFFKKFIDSISRELQFVIDDLSSEDSSAVGVTWHLEWKGKPFPFSKGCSFYRLDVANGKRQIIYARDSVEPAIKPGQTALVCTVAASIVVVTSLHALYEHISS